MPVTSTPAEPRKSAKSTKFDEIDWDDTDSILHGCSPLLETLFEDRPLLAGLIDNVVDDPRLSDLCEGYDFMRKIVLYDDPDAGVRVRLHLYSGGHYDRPHNHRWSFASCIRRGRYRHRIFGDDTGFDETTDAAALRPIIDRYEARGALFALHHRSVHAVAADRDTVSVIVRGPAAKQQFLIHDIDAGGFDRRAWRSTGDAS